MNPEIGTETAEQEPYRPKPAWMSAPQPGQIWALGTKNEGLPIQSRHTRSPEAPARMTALMRRMRAARALCHLYQDCGEIRAEFHQKKWRNRS